MNKKYLIFFCVLLLFQSFYCRITSAEEQEKKTELKPGLNNQKMWHEGIEREFDIQLPANFHINKSYPVVFVYHGFGGVKGFGIELIGSLVDREEVIGIYPQGVLNSWNTGWEGIPSEADDVGFTLELLKWIKKEINIDEKRVYAAGYSNGAVFSHKLARETNVFAAVSPIAGSLWQGQTIEQTAEKISVIQIHGSEDKKVPFEGGKSSAMDLYFESAMKTAELWAEHNRLSLEPETDRTIEDVIIYRFKKVDSPFEVVLYSLEGATHHLIDHYYFQNTSKIILDFFKEHPKTLK